MVRLKWFTVLASSFLLLVFDNNSVNGRIDSGRVNKGTHDQGHGLNGYCFKNDVMGSFQGNHALYLHRLLRSVTYVPFASKDYYSLITGLIRGKDSEVDQVDLEKLCLKRMWDLDKRELHMFALDSSAIFSCLTNPSLHHTIRCRTRSHPSASLQLAIADTDGETYALVVGCLSDGTEGKFWMVFSDLDTLTVETKQTILKKVAELGFETNGVAPSYEHCDKKPHAATKRANRVKRTAKTTDECAKYFPTSPTTIIPTNLNFIKRLLGGVRLVPEGSISYYNWISVLLTNRTLEDFNNPLRACFKRKFDFKKNQLIVTGFGKTKILDCKYKNFDVSILPFGKQGNPTVDCRNEEMDFHTIISVAFTDGVSFALLSECFETGEMVWTIAILNGIVTKAIGAVALKQLDVLNINEMTIAETYVMHYNKCYEKKPGDLDSNEIVEEETTTTRRTTTKRTTTTKKPFVPKLRPGQTKLPCETVGEDLANYEAEYDRNEVLTTLKKAYASAGSSGYYDYLAREVQYRDIESNQELRRLCPRIFFSRNEMRTYGFGVKVPTRCDTTDLKKIVCKSETNKKLNGTNTVTHRILWFENKCAMTYSCLGNGFSHWALLCQQHAVSPDALDRAHRQVEFLNFEKLTTYDYPYESCSRAEEHQLEPSKDKEPDSNLKACTNETDAERFFDAKDFFRTGGFIPYASEGFYNEMSLLLTGKRLDKNDESIACLHQIKANESDNGIHFNYTIIGFGEHSTIECTTYNKDSFGFMCEYKEIHQVTWNANGVLTHKKDFVLFAVCFTVRDTAWFVLSKSKKLSEANKKLVDRALIKFGLIDIPKEIPFKPPCTGPTDAVPHRLPYTGPCLPNPPLLDPKAYRFFKEMAKEELFIPMASSKFYSLMSVDITGAIQDATSGKKDKCLRRTWNGDKTVLSFHGWGGTLNMKCHSLNSSSYECNTLNAKQGDEKYQLYPIYTDFKKYIVIVGCRGVGEDRQRIWYVVSKGDRLHYVRGVRIVNVVITNVKFSTRGEENDQSNCADKKKEENRNFKGPECFKDNGVSFPTLPEGDVQFIKGKFSKESVYIPWGNRDYFMNMTTFFTKKKTIDEVNMDEACLRRTWIGANMQEFKMSGFGIEKTVKCPDSVSDSSKFLIKCPKVPIGGNKPTITLSPVKTDRKTFVLVVGCISKIKVWFVVSRTASVDATTRRLVETEIKKFHFEKKDEFRIDYSKCKDKIDPEPVCPDILSTNTKFTPAQLKFINEFWNGRVINVEGSLEYFSVTKNFLLQNIEEVDDNSDAECTSNEFDIENGQLLIEGYGKRKTLNCKFKSFVKTAAPGLICTSTRSENANFHMSMIPVWTDGYAYVLFVICPPSGEKIWVLSRKPSTTTREPDPPSITTILKKFTFDPKNRVPVPVDNCPGKVKKPICPDILSTNIKFTPAQIKFIALLWKGRVVNAEGSREYFSFTRNFLKNLAITTKYRDPECATNQLNIATEELTTTGYGKSRTLSCKFKSFVKTSGSPPGLECTGGKYGVSLVPVWTDSRTSVVFIGCPEDEDGPPFWVLSRKPNTNIRETERPKITSILERIGFDFEKGLQVPGEDCDDLAPVTSTEPTPLPPRPRCPDILSTQTKFTPEQLKFISKIWKGPVVNADGSPEFFSFTRRFLKDLGTEDVEDPDGPNMKPECTTNEFDVKTGHLRIGGYGEEKTLNCKFKVFRKNTNSGLECKGQGGFDVNLLPVYTDGRTFVLFIGCPENFWVISRLPSTKIDKTQWVSITDILKSPILGFDTTKRITVPGRDCDLKIINGGGPATEPPIVTNRPRCPDILSTQTKFTSEQLKFISKIWKGPVVNADGSPEFFSFTKRFLKDLGTEDVEDPDGPNLKPECTTNEFDVKTGHLVITGYGEERTLDCKFKVFRKNTNAGLDCKGQDDNGAFDASLVPVWTDGRTYVLFVGCPDNFWVISRLPSTKIDKTQWVTITDILKSPALGFDTTKRITVPGKKCDLKISGGPQTPRPTDGDEDACPDMKKLVASLKFSTQQTNYISKLKKAQAFVPVGNRAYYNALSLILRKKPIKDEDLDKACIKGKFLEWGKQVIIKGFGQEKYLDCESKTVNQHGVCRNKDGTFELNYAVVLTNAKTFVLMVGCTEDGKVFWAMASSSNRISIEDRHMARIYLENLGFQGQKTIQPIILNYGDECEDDEEETTSPASITGDICPNMKKLVATLQFTTKETNYINKLKKMPAFVPVGNRAYYNALSLILRKKPLGDDFLDKACIKGKFIGEGKQLVLTGFGNQVVLNCQSKSTNPGGICTTKDGTFEIDYAVVLTNGKSFILMVGCTDDGKLIWAIASSTNRVSIADRLTARLYLESLGIEALPGKEIILNYIEGQCESDDDDDDTSTKKPKQDFDEEKCDTIDSIPVWEAQGYSRETIINTLSNAYIPMANFEYFNQINAEIHGRPVKSVKDLANLCPRVKFHKNLMKIEGFGDKILSDCDSTDLSHIRCMLEDSTNIRELKYQTFHHTILWIQDGCAFTVSCVTNGKRNWALICKSTTVSEAVKERTRKILNQMIVTHPDKPYEFSYKNCKFDDEEEPTPPDPTGATCDPTSPSLAKHIIRKLKVGLIQNVYHRNKCLRVVGKSKENNVKYELATCNPEDPSQLVRLNGENTWSPSPKPLILDFNGKCLSADDGLLNGVMALQWDCVDKPNQRWLSVNGDFLEVFEIANQQNGYCITPRYDTHYGSLTLWLCHPKLEENRHQFWRIRSPASPLPPCTTGEPEPEPSGGVYKCGDVRKEPLGLIENMRFKGKCVRVVGKSSENKVKYELADCDPADPSQLVRLNGENSWSPKAKPVIFDFNGKCLSAEAGTFNGVLAVQSDCQNTKNQFWQIANGDYSSAFELHNEEKGLCLTPDHEKGVGALALWVCHNKLEENVHQFWRIRSPGCGPAVQSEVGPTDENRNCGDVKKDRLGLIENIRHVDKCLRVVGMSQENDAKYELAKCDPNDRSQIVRLNQEKGWSPKPQLLIFDFNGKCMSSAQGMDKSEQIVQSDCVNRPDQFWYNVNGDYFDVFELQNYHGKCLTPKYDTHIGNPVLFTCFKKEDGTPHQFWRIRTILPPCGGPTIPVVTPKPEPECGDIRKDSVGLLENVKHKNKCLRVVGKSKANGAKYDLAPCDQTDESQLIKLNGENSWSENSRHFTFYFNGKCMSADDGIYNSVAVLQWDCVDKLNQEWAIVNGNFLKTFEVANRQSGYCLTPSADTTVGTMTLWLCHPKEEGNPHQFWRVRPLVPPCGQSPSGGSDNCVDIRTFSLGLIENAKYKGKCLHVVEGSKSIYAALELIDCDHTDNSQWVKLKSWSNPETIIFQISGMCIDPKGQYPQNGVVINQYNCLPNTHHQNWQIINGEFTGTFQFQNEETRRCITPPSGETHAGDNVQWDCSSRAQALQQYWRILPLSDKPPCGSTKPGTGPPSITTPMEKKCDALDVVPISGQSNYNRAKIIQTLSTAYVNIAGTPNNFQLANEATGQQYTNVSDLANLCPKYVFSGNSLEIYGFGRKTPVNCDTSDLGHIRCKPDGTRVITDYTFHHSLLAFEGDCVISVSCLTNGTRNWAVLCPTPKIQGVTTKYKALLFLKKLGIDVSYSWDFKYTNC